MQQQAAIASFVPAAAASAIRPMFSIEEYASIRLNLSARQHECPIATVIADNE